MTKGIWSTLEFHCIASGFDHKQYVDIHKTTDCTSEPLSLKGYTALERTFYIEMDEYDKTHPSQEITSLEELDGR